MTTKRRSGSSIRAGNMALVSAFVRTNVQYQDYGFPNEAASHMHRHFLPRVFALGGNVKPGLRVLDVGCGNGFTAGQFLAMGCEVVGMI